MMRAPMVSSTQQFERIRKRKARRAGIRRKRAMRAGGTPAFPIHPAGYDPKAPDARPTADQK
jgi:DNA invertase Pin-like site-specific DNA recombinase